MKRSSELISGDRVILADLVVAPDNQQGCRLQQKTLPFGVPAWRTRAGGVLFQKNARSDRYEGAMQQVADWLEKLGLGQYAQRFAEK